MLHLIHFISAISVHFSSVSDYGGGSGGRIAVYLRESYRFQGQIQAIGGPSNYPGGPGTIYKHIETEEFIRRELEIDDNAHSNAPDTVNLEEGIQYEFDVVNLLRGAKVFLQVSAMFLLVILEMDNFFCIFVVRVCDFMCFICNGNSI